MGGYAEQKITYPKSIFFIVVNEFCERFSFYGLRTILSVYLKLVLKYSEDTATIIYHTFVTFSYLTCLIGSIISDSWLGKFKTIFYLSIVYAIGNVILSLSSASHVLPGLPNVEFCMIGLAVIALGTGGIKPCVSAFGGDQFTLPQQEKQLAQFFSIFYFAINSGSLVSTFLSPELRIISCLGRDDCYPLAFGIPAALMVVSLIIFLIGKPWYLIKMPEGNMVVKVSKCIGHGVAQKFRNRKTGIKHTHWLDHASDQYDSKLIEEIKIMLKVLVLFLPVPIYWALFDQQGTRWTFQAMRMDGKVGGWTIQPDQMQVINPFLILLFIPLFETVVYPLLAKVGLLKKPLQRLVTGGMLAGLAFIISAIVELQIEPDGAVVPQMGQAQLRIYNGIPNEPLILNAPNLALDNYQLYWNDSWTSTFETNDISKYDLSINGINYPSKIEVQNEKSFSYIITKLDATTTSYSLTKVNPDDDVKKTDSSNPKFKMIYNIKSDTQVKLSDSYSLDLKKDEHGSEYVETKVNSYNFKIGSQEFEVDMKIGAVYHILLLEESEYYLNVFEVTPSNKIHMLWLIPQYVVLTAAEIMFSITGLEFSYSQAPVSMKSVLSAFWQWTVAFGNIIVIIISSAKFFESQANEFFLFAGLMFADMLILIVLAYRYKYVERNVNEPNEETHLELSKKSDGTVNGKENASYVTE